MTARLAAVRAVVGLYVAVWLAVRLPNHLDLTRLPEHRWDPVGVLAGLAGPPPRLLAVAVAVAAIPSAAALAAGWWARVTAPVTAVLGLLVTTYASSWGQLFHTENVVVLHLLVLGVALASRRGPGDPDLVLRAMAAATAAAYVVSGIAKLRNSGWDWLAGDALRDQVAFDNVRKAVIGGATSPFASTVLDHAWLFAPMAVAALAVELGAPLALLGRRAAPAWSAAAWCFHLGVLALMAIAFPYQLSGVAFAPLLPVERLHPRTLRARWSASPSPLPSSSPP